MMSRTLTAALACCLAVTGCGTGNHSSLEIGMKRVALDLVFRDAKYAKPNPPQIIIDTIPAPPGVTPSNIGDYTRPVPQPPIVVIPPSVKPCPKASAGSTIAVPVRNAVYDPPPPGTYPRHNSGRTTIDPGDGKQLVVPFPNSTTWTVGRSVAGPESSPVDSAKSVEYDVTKQLSPTYRVTDRYRLTDMAIQLVRRTTKDGTGTTVFEPTPAIDMYVFGIAGGLGTTIGNGTGSVGDSWQSSGTDAEHGIAMVYQAKIVRREAIDVCGTLIDSYRVEADEQIVDLQHATSTMTAQGVPNVYNFATQFHGFVAREQIHTSTRKGDTGTGTPLTINLDYTSTASTMPRP
jgi:hypothetical protein